MNATTEELRRDPGPAAPKARPWNAPARLLFSVLAALDELLPGYWCRSNPVDLVAAVGPDLAASTLTMLVESEVIDAVVVLGILRSPSTGWTSDDPAPAGAKETPAK